jgi:UDP:flavonoid glycosyltransferase YjiC (YdhE family)
LGVGPAPIPQKKLAVENLAAAIETAVSDKTMQAKATELGEKIRGENGVATAVSFIEKTPHNLAIADIGDWVDGRPLQ